MGLSLVPRAGQSLCSGRMVRRRASVWGCCLGAEASFLVKLVARIRPNFGHFFAFCIELGGHRTPSLPCHHVHILNRKSGVRRGCHCTQRCTPVGALPHSRCLNIQESVERQSQPPSRLTALIPFHFICSIIIDSQGCF